MIEYHNEKRTYTVNGKAVPRVTEILKLTTNFGMLPHNITENARDRGTNVHTITEYYDAGTLDVFSVAVEYQPFLDAWIKFKAEVKCEIISMEKIIYHDKLNYAGRFDRIVKIGKKVYVLDIKTGACIYRETALQVEAYRQALLRMNDYSSDVGRCAVLLKDDASYIFDRFDKRDSDSDFFIFKSYLTVYNFLHKQ